MQNQEYFIKKFHEYAGFVRFKKSTNSYYGSCNICHEGKSWGKKHRLYYLLDKDQIFCHNCGYSSKPVNYVMESSGSTYHEVMKELENGEFTCVSNKLVSIEPQDIEEEDENTEDLPKDCIDLYNKSQVLYYKDNEIVKTALKFLIDRKLYHSINRPTTFLISLNDFIHKNRLVIPSYDINNKVVHYQTRSLFNKTDFDKIRYLSKSKSDKTIFNINKIDQNIRTIYIFEGAFNSCFVKNGVAVSGITRSKSSIFTEKQEKQLRAFPFHNIVFILDNQWIDDTAREKTQYLIDKGYEVFIWPEKLKDIKDFNDLAIKYSLTQINETFIRQFVYKDAEANKMLKEIIERVQIP